MRFFIQIGLVLLCFAPFPAKAEQAPLFFDALYDVPVMPGLQELPEQSLVFDKPSGRIAQSAAASEFLSKDTIEKFYSESLPQLGWSQISENAYVRDQEKLRITVDKQENMSIVHFMLAPR